MFRVLFDKIASVYFTLKYIDSLALVTASQGNQHCANCIGTLSFHLCGFRKLPSFKNTIKNCYITTLRHVTIIYGVYRLFVRVSCMFKFLYYNRQVRKSVHEICEV